MTLETQAQFAKRLRRDRSYVTRLKHAGRLVMVDGLVDVEASMERLESTRGHRYDVEERNAAERTAQTDTTSPDPDQLGIDEIGRRTRLAQMQQHEATARIRQREEQEQAGVLVRRASVHKALTDASQVILNAAETLPDRLTPLLLGVSDPNHVRSVLRGEVESLLHQISEQLTSVAAAPQTSTQERAA